MGGKKKQSGWHSLAWQRKAGLFLLLVFFVLVIGALLWVMFLPQLSATVSSGVLQINNGAFYTADRDVSLSLPRVPDAAQLVVKQVDGDAVDQWAYARRVPFRLQGEPGLKQVTVAVMDAEGQVLTTMFDEIIFDDEPPVVPTLKQPVAERSYTPMSVRFVGTSEPGTMVYLELGDTVYHTQTAQNGSWVIQPPKDDLSARKYDFCTWAADQAGNRSAERRCGTVQLVAD